MHKKVTPAELPERDEIIALLKQQKQALKHRQIADIFLIEQPKLRVALDRRLRAMARDRQLFKNNRGGYSPTERLATVKGYVQAHPDGYGFVITDPGAKDLFLSNKEMRTVLNGDYVLAKQTHSNQRGKCEGFVVEVLAHANHQLVGRYYTADGFAYVTPDNERLTQNVLIETRTKMKPKQGQYVVVKLTRQPQKHYPPAGEIVGVIEDGHPVTTAATIVKYSYDLPFEWSKAVRQELSHIDDSVTAASRIDLRALPFVTIDGDDAQDFDDAVFCEQQADGDWRLLVAIADVSHYIKPDTALDDEAKRRGTSVYFPTLTIPMLPERLSNGLCSLKPKVARYVLVCELIIDEAGQVSRSHFFRAVIKSAARLTYTEVEQMVVAKVPQSREKYKKLLPHLDNLYQLYQVLHRARQDSGLIDFNSFESKFIFNDAGDIDNIYPAERNQAHRIIEELMLLANTAAAVLLEQNKIATLYRIHLMPAVEKLGDLRALLAQFGLALGGKSTPSAKDYADLIQAIRESDAPAMLETLLVRSMPLASYSTVNEHHFGLGFDNYVHFTSPIRRYPDLTVHRGIIGHLENNPVAILKDTEAISALAEHCSVTERRAEKASRDLVKRLQCIFMQDKVGETFTGTVSTVTSFGLFVVLDAMGVEGLIHVSSLDADYYHFDVLTQTLRGEHTGLEFCLGERLTVTVARVDLTAHKIDFELCYE